jgi:hypothetical protein
VCTHTLSLSLSEILSRPGLGPDMAAGASHTDAVLGVSVCVCVRARVCMCVCVCVCACASWTSLYHLSIRLVKSGCNNACIRVHGIMHMHKYTSVFICLHL